MTILIISCNYHFLFFIFTPIPCTMVKGYKKSPQTSLSTFSEICCYFRIFYVNILSKHTVSYILLFHIWQNSICCFIFQKLIIESLCFNYSNLLILISRRFSGYSYFSECLNPYVRCFLFFHAASTIDIA